MKKINGKFVANVGIFSALGLVLDLVAKFIPDFWGAGGSISIAMVPIFLMAYYYGWLGGICTGFIMGVVQLLWGSPAGILGALLDYVLPYTAVGLAGIFVSQIKEQSKTMKYVLFGVSIVIAGLIRIFFHTLSGVVLYETPWLGSFIYNAPYVLISIGLSLILTLILIDRLDVIFYWKRKDKETEVK